VDLEAKATTQMGHNVLHVVTGVKNAIVKDAFNAVEVVVEATITTGQIVLHVVSVVLNAMRQIASNVIQIDSPMVDRIVKIVARNAPNV